MSVEALEAFRIKGGRFLCGNEFGGLVGILEGLLIALKYQTSIESLCCLAGAWDFWSLPACLPAWVGRGWQKMAKDGLSQHGMLWHL